MVEIAFAIFFLMVIVLPLLFTRRVHRPSDRGRLRMEHGSWICGWCYARQYRKPMIIRRGWTQPVCERCNELFDQLRR